jgi:hypothetical protein
LKSAYFFGEAPERRPWAINAKIARLLLPGVPNLAFLAPLVIGIPPLPIQASILSHRNIYEQLQQYTRRSGI